MSVEFENIPTADGSSPPESETELTDEEIEFFRDASGDSYNRTVAMSRLIADNYPEIGTRELHTSTVLARELGKNLGNEAVKILLVDKENDENKWVDWKEFSEARRVLGEENIETNGVFGILEGDDPQGPIILIRGDMDAMLTQDGEAKHMCGHNVHTSWLKMNCEILKAYREKFGRLPFQRVVFVGEVNEEGMASPVFGPVEMVKAGLFDVAGKPDIVIGSHIVACQPEGTVAVEEGAALSGEGRFNIRLIPRQDYRGPDLEVIKNEIEYRIAQEMKGEEPMTSFGTMRLAENIAEELPKVLVRIADSKTASQKDELRANSLKGQYSFSAEISGNLETQKTPEGLRREDELIIEKTIEKAKEIWDRLGVPVDYEIRPSEGNRIEFSIRARPGHVSFGGPNVEYLGSAVIHALNDRYGSRIKSDVPIEEKEIVGSIRMRTADWKNQGEECTGKVKDIVDGVLAEIGEVGVTAELSWSIDVPPVINDNKLRDMTLVAAQKAGIEISEAGLPNMAAETFSFWQQLSDAPGIYLAIGGASRELFEETLKSGDPIPEEMMHHNPSFTYQDNAIPYGAIMSALAVRFGKAKH